MTGIVCDQLNAQKQLITADFMIDNSIYKDQFACSEESLFHFDIGIKEMEQLHENELAADGRSQCHGFPAPKVEL